MVKIFFFGRVMGVVLTPHQLPPEYATDLIY